MTVVAQENRFLHSVCTHLSDLRGGPPVVLNTSYNKAGEPGIYTFEWSAAGKRRREHVVYNLDTDSGESDLTKIKMKEIKKRLSETPVILIGKLVELEKTLLSVLHGKEASRMVVFFIFGILILEGYVANRRRREK